MKYFFYSFIASLLLAPSNLVLATTGENMGTQMEAQTNAFIKASGFGTMDLALIISTLIQILLGFLGIIFLVLTIISGFKWMMAQGNEEIIKKSRTTLINAIIGLVIVLAAYIITAAIFRLLPFGGTGTGVGGA